MSFSTQQARAAFGPIRRSLSNRSQDGTAGMDEKCSACGEPFTDGRSPRISMGGVAFHSSCFKCSHCQVSLLSCPYASLDDVYYCKPHYLEMMKLKADPNANRARNSSLRLPSSPTLSPDSAYSKTRESSSGLTPPRLSSVGSASPIGPTPTSPSPSSITPGGAMRKAVLVVTCAKASNLTPNGSGVSTNPFVKVTFRGKTFKTQKKNSTVNPEWLEFFEFNVSERDDEIRFQVCNHEDGALPDILGHYSTKVGPIFEKIDSSQVNFYEEIYNIQSLNDSSTSTGQLCIGYKLRYPLSEKDEENRQYSDRFERFLENAKFSPNDKKILSMLRTDEKRKKLRELTSLKAREFGDLFKANKIVPLVSLSDFRNCLSEKLFLKTFVAGEGNLDALLLFLVDPQVFDVTPEIKSIFPDTVASTRMSTLSVESRTRSLVRSNSVPTPSDPVLPVVSSSSCQGLNYEVSGRSAAGGIEGRPCIFTVTFKIDGQPLPSDTTKEDLVVYVDCPGTPSLPLINLGTGSYQIGINPKVAGQHWLDFMWRGQWCSQPFLLPIRSTKNVVPDHPYTGVERRNAAPTTSATATAAAAAATTSPSSDGAGSSSITKELSQPLSQPLPEERALDCSKKVVLLQHQEEARLLVVEVFRDFFALHRRALNSLAHPRFISTLSTVIAYLESLSSQSVPIIRIAFYGVLSVICGATPFCENLFWDGHAVVVDALLHYQIVRKENQPYETVVSTLKESTNCAYALTALVLINCLLETSRSELRSQTRNGLLACDVFGVVQEVKKRFVMSAGVVKQINIFEKKIDFTPISGSVESKDEAEIDFSSVKNIAQTLVDSNDTPASGCFLNILKGLSRLSKDNPDSLRKWLNIDYLVDELTKTNISGDTAYLNLGGTLVKREEIEKAVDEKVQREEKLRTECLIQKAEIERLTKLNEEYFQTIKSLKEGSTQATPKALEPPPKKDFSIQSGESKPYTASKPSKELRPIPWKNINPSISIESTIFGSIDPNNAKLNTDALESMFQKESGAKEPSTVKNKISLLRKLRFNEISECFQKLENNKQIMQKGIKNGKSLTNFFKDLFFGKNKDVLSLKLVEIGMKCLPNTEEQSNLKDWLANNPPETTDPQELTEIDNFQLSIVNESEEIFIKLHCLKFETYAQQKLEKLRSVISLLRSACGALNESQEILSIIEILVAIGNFVNFSHQSSFNLSSFDVRFLSELKNIRSCQPNTNINTLLDYLVNLISEQNPDLLNWTQIVPQLSPFCRISWDNTEEELTKLLSDSDRIQEDLNNLSFDEGSKLKLMLLITEINETSQFFQQSFQEWTELTLKFGIVDKDVTPPRFFEIFVSLSEDFCESQIKQKINTRNASQQQLEIITEQVKTELAPQNQNSSWESLKKVAIENKKSSFPSNLIGDIVSGRKRR